MRTKQEILKELKAAKEKLQWLYEQKPYITEDNYITRYASEDISIITTKAHIEGLEYYLWLLDNKPKKNYPTWIKR